jgi:hypothetical protein
LLKATSAVHAALINSDIKTSIVPQNHTRYVINQIEAEGYTREPADGKNVPIRVKLTGDCTSVIIAVLVRSPPLREQVRLSGRALHREGQDEHHDLGSPIER